MVRLHLLMRLENGVAHAPHDDRCKSLYVASSKELSCSPTERKDTFQYNILIFRKSAHWNWYERLQIYNLRKRVLLSSLASSLLQFGSGQIKKRHWRSSSTYSAVQFCLVADLHIDLQLARSLQQMVRHATIAYVNLRSLHLTNELCLDQWDDRGPSYFLMITLCKHMKPHFRQIHYSSTACSSIWIKIRACILDSSTLCKFCISWYVHTAFFVVPDLNMKLPHLWTLRHVWR